jgi:hypothetical protein
MAKEPRVIENPVNCIYWPAFVGGSFERKIVHEPVIEGKITKIVFDFGKILSISLFENVLIKLDLSLFKMIDFPDDMRIKFESIYDSRDYFTISRAIKN